MTIVQSEEVEAAIDRGVEQIGMWKAMNYELRGTYEKRPCIYCRSWLSQHLNNFHFGILKKCNECGANFKTGYKLKRHLKICEVSEEASI